MLVYMNDYRKTRIDAVKDAAGETRLKNGTYGDDVDANWNPAVLHAIHIPPQRSLSPELPDDLSALDAELLMDRIYALASQV